MKYKEQAAAVNRKPSMSDRRSRAAHTPSPTAPGRARRMIRALLWAGAAIVLIEALFGARGLTAMLEARRQHEALEASLATLRAENARLREEATRLREDPSAIEEAARRDLQFIEPGEKLFIIRDPRPE